MLQDLSLKLFPFFNVEPIKDDGPSKKLLSGGGVNSFTIKSKSQGQWPNLGGDSNSTRHKTRVPLSPFLFILTLEILNTQIRQNSRIRWLRIKGKEYKLQAYANDLVLLLENPKELIR